VIIRNLNTEIRNTEIRLLSWIALPRARNKNAAPPLYAEGCYVVGCGCIIAGVGDGLRKLLGL
jgi:hypothetical protein